MKEIVGRAAIGIRQRNLLANKEAASVLEIEEFEVSNRLKEQLGRNQKRKEFTKEFVGYMNKKEEKKRPKKRVFKKKEPEKKLFYPVTFSNEEGNALEIDLEAEEEAVTQTDYF